MGLMNMVFGKKEDKGLAVKVIWEYVESQIDSLMATWISMEDELKDFPEIERKEMLRDEIHKINRGATELLKAEKIKVPPDLFLIAREAINEKTVDRIKPLLHQFVCAYRRPNLQWPHETDVPLKDLGELKAAIKDNNITLEFLNYDPTEEKIRSLLIQYGLRKKPEFQNADAWSRNFSYSHDDLILLAEVLKAKGVKVQGIEQVKGDLWVMVKQELLRQQDEQFVKAFRAANPNLAAAPTKIEWALAYSRALKKDLDYIPYVERMALLTGTVFEKNELRGMVTEILSGNIPRSALGLH